MGGSLAALLLGPVVVVVTLELDDPTRSGWIGILVGFPLDLGKSRLLSRLVFLLITLLQIGFVPIGQTIEIHLLDARDMELHAVLVRKFLGRFFHQHRIALQGLFDRFVKLQAHEPLLGSLGDLQTDALVQIQFALEILILGHLVLGVFVDRRYARLGAGPKLRPQRTVRLPKHRMMGRKAYEQE